MLPSRRNVNFCVIDVLKKSIKNHEFLINCWYHKLLKNDEDFISRISSPFLILFCNHPPLPLGRLELRRLELGRLELGRLELGRLELGAQF